MTIPTTEAHWRLARRYGHKPLSFPVNEQLARMFSAVFSEQQADLLAAFPAGGATAAQIARRAHLTEELARSLLTELDTEGSILAYVSGGQPRYLLLPIIPGLFESFMRNGIDDERRRVFAEAFEQYLDPNYYPRITPDGIAKIIPVERHIVALPGVLPTDKVTEVIEAHDRFALTICCCRHSRELTGEGCGLPKDVCMAFGGLADWAVARNIARRAEKAEMLEAARRAEEAGLVHLADNTARTHFLCSCCACCCAGLRALTELNRPAIIANSHFVAQVDFAKCSHCGKCVRRCPSGALGRFHKKLVFAEHRCIGCGVCISACRKERALALLPRPHYQPPHESLSHFAAELGLQAFGLKRLLGDRLPGAYGKLKDALAAGIDRKPVRLTEVGE
jgi:Pyruvate/2-oxoacid:ferredoxin oxidoreductase delta subunit